MQRYFIHGRKGFPCFPCLDDKDLLKSNGNILLWLSNACEFVYQIYFIAAICVEANMPVYGPTPVKSFIPKVLSL